MSRKSLPETPYKGLVPYSEQDADFFFGRDPEIQIIMANLMASRLTVLYGPSGVGKSSVLRAGVVHDLKNIIRQNMQARGTPEFAVVNFNLWRDDPISGLLEKVREAVAETIDVDKMEPVPSSGSLSESLQAWTERLGGPLFIILDQFEEYFLYHSRDKGAGSFAANFAQAVNNPALRANFIVSLREDWLAKLDRFKGLIPNLFNNYLRIEHLDLDAARDAITKPIDEYNLLIEDPPQRVGIEQELVREVLNQLEPLARRVGLTEAGRGAVATDEGSSPAEARIQTSYLQLVMTRIWEEESRSWNGEGSRRVLRLRTLTELGNANQILRTHLGNVMANLTKEEQEAAARIFHYLVTPDGTKIAYTASNLSKLAELDEAELTRVLDKLAEKSNSILTPVAAPPDQPEASRYEIFHDMLAPAILEWRGRYVEAQRRERAAREAATKEKEAAIQRQIRAQAKATRRFRRLAVAMAIVSVIAVVAAGFASFQLVRANTALNDAERAGKEADDQKANALKAAEAAILSEAKAVKAAGIAEEERIRAELAANRERAAKQEIDAQRNEALQQREIAEQQRELAEEQKELADAARQEVEEQKKLATARLIGVQADSIGTFRPDLMQLSTLLGAESIKITPNSEGDRAVSNGLATLPRQTSSSIDYSGDAMSVYRPVALTEDGKYLAAGYTDPESKTPGLQFWDIAAHKQILLPSKGAVSQIKFSSNGQYLFYKDETSHVWDAANRREIFNEKLNPKEITQDVSPDGRFLGTIDEKGIIRIRELGSGKTVAPLDQKGNVIDLVYDPSGQVFATRSERIVRLWKNPEKTELGSPLEHTGTINSMLFSPNGEYLVTVSSGNDVRLWNARSGILISSIPQTDYVNQAAFTPDGDYLALAGSNNVKVWKVRDPQTGVAPRKEEVDLQHKDFVSRIAFTPDGKYLATKSGEITTVWNWKSRQEVSVMNTEAPGGTSYNSQIAFSRDGRDLIITAKDKAVVWNVLGSPPDIQIEKGEETKYLGMSLDGNYLVTVDKSDVTVWEVSTGKEVTTVKLQSDTTTVTLSPDGRYLVTGTDETGVIWELPSGKRLRELEVKQVIIPLNGIASMLMLDGQLGPGPILFSPDRKHIAVATESGLKILELNSMKEVTSLSLTGSGPSDPDSGLDFMFANFYDKGRYIAASAYRGKRVKVWETLTGRMIGDIDLFEGIKRDDSGFDSDIVSPLISPDGRYVAFSTDMKSIKVWEVATNRVTSNLTLDGKQVFFPLAFSSNSLQLATNSKEGIKVFDVTNGKEIRALRQDLGPMADVIKPALKDKQTNSDFDVTLSPDGHYLGVVLNEKFVRVWKVTGGESSQADIIPAKDIELSPDGKYVITSDKGKGVRLWRLRPLDLTTTPCERLTRNLTEAEWRRYIGSGERMKTCPDLP
ncbi:MAG TPA: hypothetical protein VF131_14185 [Blastocatellia bacterium]|nr:hypothetical protein [Blastocatellia bacterium]